MSTDALIMLRRNFKHTARNPVTVFNAVLLPVVIMLMFVYMLGNAFSVGVKYIDYATPGMILLAIGLRSRGHRDRGERRHDEGNHQPVPGHGRLSRRRADRSCRRHHAAQPDIHRGHHRGGLRAGIPPVREFRRLARR